MTHTPSTISSTGTLRIALREVRLILDRMLMQTGMPSGAMSPVRECVIVSEALGQGGLQRFHTLQPTLGAQTTEPVRVAEQADGVPAMDAAGQHVWQVAQIAIDLLLAEAATGGAASLRIHNIAGAEEMPVIPPLAARLGASVTLQAHTAGTHVLTLQHRTPAPADHTDAVLWRVIRDGLTVDAALWWSIYNRSLAALAPDSVVSRRHAGANIVDDSGKVIGRMTDDDTDFSLLRAPGKHSPLAHPTPTESLT